jgi:hypothetical protein
MATNVINDTFDGAAGNVNAHTANTGGTWAYESLLGTATANLNGSGVVSQPSSGAGYSYLTSSEVLLPDTTVRTNFTNRSALPYPIGNHEVAAGARWDSDTHSGYIAIHVQGQAYAVGEWVYLYRYKNSTSTLLSSFEIRNSSANATLRVGVDLSLQLAGTGSSVSCTVKLAGTTYITYSDTSASRVVDAGKMIWGVRDVDGDGSYSTYVNGVQADGTTINPVTYTETGSIADAHSINSANSFITPFIETGTADNATILSGADQYGFGYSEVGSMGASSAISGVDAFVTGYPEFSSVAGSVTFSGTDSYTQSFVETSSLSNAVQLGNTTSGAQGGLAFLFTGGGTSSDTYSTTLTYAETSTLNETSLLSSADTFNVYSEAGSAAEMSTIGGVDNFYSVIDLYQESSTLSLSEIFSGLDSFPWFETGTFGQTSTISGSDTYGNHLFTEMVAYVNADASFGNKSIVKQFDQDIKVRPRLRHNLFTVDMEVDIPVQPKMTKASQIAVPQTTHKMRERQSVHIV